MLSIADVMLLALASISLFDNLIGINRKKYSIINDSRYRHFGPIILIVFLVFLTLISILISGNIMLTSVIIRILRYGLFMYTVSILGYHYFDSKYAIRIIVGISIVATIYILIQTIVYYSIGIVLPFIIPFLEPVVSEYKDISGLISWYNQFYYRPQSFFMEPAHFSQYNLVSLALCLFWKGKFNEPTRIRTAIFISLGLVLSTSSIGVVIGLFIWCGLLLNVFSNKITRKKVLILFILFFILLILSPVILDIDRITTPIFRVFQTTARTTDSFSLFSALDIKQRIVGVGLGNEKLYLGANNRITFMNSLTIFLLSAGYFGLLAFIMFFMDLIIHKKGVSRLLAISLFILSFGSEIFFTYTGIVWLLFIYYRDKEFRFFKTINNKQL
jgi:hypothetical protein